MALLNINKMGHGSKTSKNKYKKTNSENNKVYLSNLKKSQGCLICGASTWLEFHHVHPEEKEFNISGHTHYTKTKLDKEIAKCVILCRSCHKKVHSEMNSKLWEAKFKKTKLKKNKPIKKTVKSKKAIVSKKPRVPKTRNNKTMTESAYWGMIRSTLRRGTRYWKPMMACKLKARRTYVGPVKGQKWEYQCAKCKKWYMGKNTQVDHIVPVGSLRCLEDLPGFIKRLTPESGFQLLCHSCHQEKTNRERIKLKLDHPECHQQK